MLACDAFVVVLHSSCFYALREAFKTLPTYTSQLSHDCTTMAEAVEIKTCSNPGCDQPGIKSCSACKTTFYCCVICQTADWTNHKEECPGHLRKMGKANLAKAKGFVREQNWVQTLRYAELAATKMKKLKDRRLETVQLINDAMVCKLNALNFMARFKDAMECAEERYTLWAMNQMRNPGSIDAAFALIESCIHNKKYEDAEHYARHAMFMINDMADNFIPSDQRSRFLAEGSYYLAQAIYGLAEAGGIPPEEKQKAGEEAIELARQALKLHTQLRGTESAQVASDMTTLANVLDYFNDVDDDEVLRLHEQAIAIYRRVEGTSSPNVATGENSLGGVYYNRANRAAAANDLDRYLASLELALPHSREAVRIYRAINHVDNANSVLLNIARAEEKIRQIGIAKAAAAAAATMG